MIPTEQRNEALRLANVKRTDLKDVKYALRSGRLSLTDAMLTRPDVLGHALLIDVIRWTRRQGRGRRPALTDIGKQALRDHVNLMVPLDEASLRSREWVAEYGTRYWRPSR